MYVHLICSDRLVLIVYILNEFLVLKEITSLQWFKGKQYAMLKITFVALTFQQDGKKVGILDLTKGELGTRGSAEIREKEAKDAAKILNVAFLGNHPSFFWQTFSNHNIANFHIPLTGPNTKLSCSVYFQGFSQFGSALTHVLFPCKFWEYVSK